MPTQMNYGSGGGSYKTAKEATTPVNHAQTNYGGATTKKGGGNRSRPQTNFTGKASIPYKTDPGQGQKAGTGSQGGY